MVAEPRRDADSVRELLGTMGREVLARFRKTLKSLESLDVAAARKAVAEDSRTDEQELAVERGCLDLLMAGKPGRVDVNRVLAMIKISTDVERIADVATNIAECVEPLAHLGRGDVPDEIAEMSDIATEMLTDALDAFGKKDTVLAGRVRQRDDAMDVLNEEAYRLLLEAVARDPERLEFATHYIVVSKSLERIADLCTNIAEHVIFMVTGEIVRHRGKP